MFNVVARRGVHRHTNDDDVNDDDTNHNIANVARRTKHDGIGLFGIMPNEPKKEE